MEEGKPTSNWHVYDITNASPSAPALKNRIAHVLKIVRMNAKPNIPKNGRYTRN